MMCKECVIKYHYELAMSYGNIGNIFQRKFELNLALEYQEKVEKSKSRIMEKINTN